MKYVYPDLGIAYEETGAHKYFVVVTESETRYNTYTGFAVTLEDFLSDQQIEGKICSAFALTEALAMLELAMKHPGIKLTVDVRLIGRGNNLIV